MQLPAHCANLFVGKGAKLPTPQPKIAVFVDSVDAPRRRYCYWIRYLRKKRIPFVLISIPDLRAAVIERKKRALPRLDGFDLIILNWDVANGDFAWLADETLEFFQNRGRDEIKRWAGNGSRILIEIQSAAGYPLQEVYDAVLGIGEVRVSPYRRVAAFEDAERRLVPNARRARHPIVGSLVSDEGYVETRYRPFRHVVFPGFDKSGESTYSRNRDALSFGNFTKWKSAWLPLMLRSGRDVRGKPNRPVALGRALGAKGGEVVVTTMRIANSYNHDLIDAFIDCGAAGREHRRKFYVVAERRRKVARAAEIAALWMIGVIAFVPAWNAGAQSLEASMRLMYAQSGSDSSLIAFLINNLKLAEATLVAVIGSLVAYSIRIWRRSVSS